MIYTFYSFKGGVGRSMALAGVAYLLARRGLRVLAIDFDLEAPGLERYFFEHDRGQEVRAQPGLMDLLKTYKLALTSEAEFQAGRFRSWWNFVTEAMPRLEGGGSLDLMTAGQREPESAMHDYAYAVRSFDWQDFFDNWKGEAFFTWLRQQLVGGERGYDVVLVDSRTGVTEMGGVCAYQLADAIVMLCAANQQNLEGTLAVGRDFRSDAVLALRRGRPLEILAIPSRLEDNNERRDGFMHEFVERFGTEFLPVSLAACGLDYPQLALPYDPEFAVMERLVGEPGSSARAETTFQRLSAALVLMADQPGKLRDLQDEVREELGGKLKVMSAAQLADPTRRSAGFDVFLHYRMESLEYAEWLRGVLEGAGFRVWFDREQLQPGVQWQVAIDEALENSEWLLCLLGMDSRIPEERRSSNFRQIVDRARHRGRHRILPVLVDTQPDWSLLGDYGLADIQALHLGPYPGNDSALHKLLSILRTPANKPATANTRVVVHSQDQEDDPYPGERPFREDESRYFFGREKYIEELANALDNDDIVMLSGPVGVGKSSLVRTGLVPKLRQEINTETQTTWSLEWIDLDRPSVTTPPSESVENETRTLVVLDGLDNFPEPGSYAAREERFRRVSEILASAGPRRKVLLIRRDVLDANEAEALVRAWFPNGLNEVSLQPLDAEGLTRAIEAPAAVAGHLIEPGLTKRLLDGAGGSPSAVAQIQRLLPQLWQERRRGWLTNKAFDSADGVVGKASQSAAEFRTSLTAVEAEALRHLVRRFVELDDAWQISTVERSWHSLASLSGLEKVDAVSLRDRLAGWHLLDFPRSGSIANEPAGFGCALPMGITVALAPDLTNLSEQDKLFLLWRRRFATLVLAWVSSNRREDDLLTGSALADAEHNAAEHGNELDALDQEFIAVSQSARTVAEQREEQIRQERLETEALREARDAAEAARAKETRAKQRARGFAWVLALMVMVLLFVGWRLYRKQDELATQQRVYQKSVTAKLASDLAATDPTPAAVALATVLDDPVAPEVARNSVFAFLDKNLSQATLAHIHAVWHAEFSPDGQRILTASSDGARLWRADGQPLAILKGHGAPVRHAKFSPDGQRIVTASEDGTARLWRADGQPLAVLKGHSGEVLHAAFSPDGQRIITASRDGMARLWRADGQPLAVLKGHGKAVNHAAFSPDGQRIVTASSDGTARLWRVDGQPQVELKGHGSLVYHAAFSPDGQRIVTASEDGTVRQWRADGQPLAVLKGHSGGVLHAAFSPDGQHIVTSSMDKTARLWWTDGQPLVEFKGHDDSVNHTALSPDGLRIVIVSGDGKARLWRTNGQLLAVLKGHALEVFHAEFSPDGQRIVTVDLSAARLWRADGQPLAELKGHSGPVWHAVFSPDGQRIITASKDGTALLWSADGQPLRELKGHVGPVRQAVFSPDGQRIITVSDDGTARLSSADGQSLSELKGHSDKVNHAAFSPDGKLIVTTSWDGTARLWRTNGQPLAVLKGHSGGVVHAAFSPDGQRIVTASVDKTARLWRTNGQLLAVLKGHALEVFHAAFSPDGQRIVTVDLSAARLWRTDGQSMGELKVYLGIVSHAAFSPDGQLIVTATGDGTHAGDGTARLWRANGQPLATLKGHGSQVLHAEFSPDGQRIITVSEDGTVQLWPIGSAAFVERIRAIADQCLTAEQRQRLFLEDRPKAEVEAATCRKQATAKDLP